ncbi:MAG: hypothetical protein AAFU49_04215 [Pseudomonadota bacterium]
MTTGRPAPIHYALAAVLLVHLPVVALVGDQAWDDGAITLAFSRTLAEVGLFALTPVSPVVEGSSSLLFAGLNAGLHALLGLSFDGALLASRALSAGFALLGCWLMAGLLTDLGESRARAAALAGVVFILPMFLAETTNGMEMSLFACLLLGLVQAVRSGRDLLAVALIGLLLLTRFEACFYLGIALSIAFLTARGARLRVVGLIAAVILLFAAIVAVRFSVFGELLPNTVLAKMNPPYSGTGLGASLFRRVEGMQELFAVLGAAAVPLAIAALPSWRRALPLDAALLAGLMVSALAFAVVAGKNWGYSGRMVLGFVPLVFVALVWVLRARMGEAARLLPPIPDAAVLALVAVVGVMASNLTLARNVVGTMAANLNTPAQSVTLTKLTQVYGTIAGPITPATFASVGTAVSALGDRLGLEEVTFLTPDVGGSALCCPGLRIIDIGGLASPEIGRHGYAVLPELLAWERPDFANPHSRFATASGIFAMPSFTEGYAPVAYRGHLLWVRADHHAVLSEGAGSEPIEAVGQSGTLRFYRHPDPPLGTAGRTVTILTD